MLSLQVGAADRVDFARDVQPILSDACYHCHGPDEQGRKAKLRVDTKEGAFKVVDGKPLIVPGKAGESELVRRITTNDEDDLMPPPDSNRKLTAKQVETIRRWVEQGAEWGEHWAFGPIVRRDLPKPRTAWGRNGTDAFVLARLEKERLAPADEAGRAALIRRVTLDLTGL
ncbi:MAG TPA: c-type cytochrome domain-containing protein, partial [Tepidisphaeraceae bacterium]|nr:c-type cytochrome domain-containing protein [Tepidisphaeraceae bacterium]